MPAVHHVGAREGKVRREIFAEQNRAFYFEAIEFHFFGVAHRELRAHKGGFLVVVVARAERARGKLPAC